MGTSPAGRPRNDEDPQRQRGRAMTRPTRPHTRWKFGVKLPCWDPVGLARNVPLFCTYKLKLQRYPVPAGGGLHGQGGLEDIPATPVAGTAQCVSIWGAKARECAQVTLPSGTSNSTGPVLRWPPGLASRCIGI